MSSGPARLEDLLASLQTISDLQSRGVLRDVNPRDRSAYLAKLTAQADQIKSLMAALANPASNNGNSSSSSLRQDANANPNSGPEEEEEELYVNLGPGSRFGTVQGRDFPKLRYYFFFSRPTNTKDGIGMQVRALPQFQYNWSK